MIIASDLLLPITRLDPKNFIQKETYTHSCWMCGFLKNRHENPAFKTGQNPEKFDPESCKEAYTRYQLQKTLYSNSRSSYVTIGFPTLHNTNTFPSVDPPTQNCYMEKDRETITSKKIPGTLTYVAQETEWIHI